jgi:hypothetical protein
MLPLNPTTRKGEKNNDRDRERTTGQGENKSERDKTNFPVKPRR